MVPELTHTVLCSVAASLLRWLSTGQFTCLLLTVDMVAVSKASSPESNPNSPRPVIALAGLDRANKLIGAIHHPMLALAMPEGMVLRCALYPQALTNNASPS